MRFKTKEEMVEDGEEIVITKEYGEVVYEFENGAQMREVDFGHELDINEYIIDRDDNTVEVTTTQPWSFEFSHFVGVESNTEVSTLLGGRITIKGIEFEPNEALHIFKLLGEELGYEVEE